MKWAYQLKHKTKAVGLLALLLIVILAGDLLERSRYSRLDSSITSIMNDRLKPANYIYSISNNLYEKKLLAANDRALPASELSLHRAKHDAEIAALIESYETTYLTPEERVQWSAFRSSLGNYNAIEKQMLASTGNVRAADAAFHKTISHLDALSSIQVGEGTAISKTSHSIINSSLLLSYLEISLLIVLGLYTLIIVSASDNAVFRQKQHQVMN
jgi:hypothetical protein